MNTTVSLQRVIQKTDEDKFIELPFEVPAGVDEIHIRVAVKPADAKPCIIDLGVCDPKQVRGWSGSSKYDLVIGRQEATPGYMAGDLQIGRWAVLLGVYVIGDAGAEVTAEIAFTSEAPRWIQGDLHMHTKHSDGTYTLAELDSIATQLELDFVALTDHNTVSQNFAYPRETKLVYIPGMELTTYHGHVNLFGVEIPCDDFRTQTSDDVRALLNQARDRGATISINHPFDDAGPSCQWRWGYDLPFSCLEVWNGPWRESNQKSAQLWQSMLVAGHRVAAVGGSDTHRPDPYVKHGYPTNYVFAASRKPADILAAVEAGHTCVSYQPHGPRIELTTDAGFMMGDVMASPGPVDVRVMGAKVNDTLVVYTEQGEITRQKIECAGADPLELRVTQPFERFVRVELWRYFAQVDDYLMAALSNPIYVSKPSH